ncbi:MAG: hypothetical protein LCH95_13835 [Proteobacteria bacterium]|nr:hypothetical protein [Pseudomonadota bacterium]
MGIRFERKVVLAKIETTYGTDPTPTGAANAVLLRGVDIDIAQGERLPRDVLRTGLGQLGTLLFGRRVTLTATVDLAGSGAAGTAPAWGPLMRACALAETVTAGTRVDYTPVDQGFESVAIYFNLEGSRTILLGCRGSAKLMLPKGKLPQIQFSLTGLWVSDTSVAYPSQTLTAWKDPLPVSKANTPTFTIDGQAVQGSNVELDGGLQVGYRELINLREIVVEDRLPTFSATIEELPLATKNFFALMSGANVALALTHGTVAGNIIQLASSTLQVQDVKRAEDQKMAMLNITAMLKVGSPDFTISAL